MNMKSMSVHMSPHTPNVYWSYFPFVPLWTRFWIRRRDWQFKSVIFSNSPKRTMRLMAPLKSLGSWADSGRRSFNKRDFLCIQITYIFAFKSHIGYPNRMEHKTSHRNQTPELSESLILKITPIRIALRFKLFKNPIVRITLLTKVWKKWGMQINLVDFGSNVYCGHKECSAPPSLSRERAAGFWASQAQNCLIERSPRCSSSKALTAVKEPPRSTTYQPPALLNVDWPWCCRSRKLPRRPLAA